MRVTTGEGVVICPHCLLVLLFLQRRPAREQTNKEAVVVHPSETNVPSITADSHHIRDTQQPTPQAGPALIWPRREKRKHHRTLQQGVWEHMGLRGQFYEQYQKNRVSAGCLSQGPLVIIPNGYPGGKEALVTLRTYKTFKC